VVARLIAQSPLATVPERSLAASRTLNEVLPLSNSAPDPDQLNYTCACKTSFVPNPYEFDLSCEPADTEVVSGSVSLSGFASVDAFTNAHKIAFANSIASILDGVSAGQISIRPTLADAVAGLSMGFRRMGDNRRLGTLNIDFRITGILTNETAEAIGTVLTGESPFDFTQLLSFNFGKQSLPEYTGTVSNIAASFFLSILPRAGQHVGEAFTEDTITEHDSLNLTKEEFMQGDAFPDSTEAPEATTTNTKVKLTVGNGLNISSAGTGYSVGDTVHVGGDSAEGWHKVAKLKVTDVDQNGGIAAVEIADSGLFTGGDVRGDYDLVPAPDAAAMELMSHTASAKHPTAGKKVRYGYSTLVVVPIVLIAAVGAVIGIRMRLAASAQTADAVQSGTKTASIALTPATAHL
jgi:hypothetical protein